MNDVVLKKRDVYHWMLSAGVSVKRSACRRAAEIRVTAWSLVHSGEQPSFPPKWKGSALKNAQRSDPSFLEVGP